MYEIHLITRTDTIYCVLTPSKSHLNLNQSQTKKKTANNLQIISDLFTYSLRDIRAASSPRRCGAPAPNDRAQSGTPLLHDRLPG